MKGNAKNIISETATLNTNDVAKFLNIGITNAYKLMNSKGFPSVQVTPRRKIVTLEALKEWLNRGNNKKEAEQS